MSRMRGSAVREWEVVLGFVACPFCDKNIVVMGEFKRRFLEARDNLVNPESEINKPGEARCVREW